MALNAGNLFVKLEADTSDFEKKMSVVQSKLENTTKKAEESLSCVQNINSAVLSVLSDMQNQIGTIMAGAYEKMNGFGAGLTTAIAAGMRSRMGDIQSAANSIVSAATKGGSTRTNMSAPTKAVADAVQNGASPGASDGSYYYSSQKTQTFSPTVNVQGGIDSDQYRREMNRLMRRQAAMVI